MSFEVIAPMQGKIVEILVNAGDTVQEDDELLILEAMKMENPVYAPADGVVKEIKVKLLDHVDSEEIVMILE